MTKELFGTDGIRGIPGTYPLDDATLYGVARALGKYLLEREPRNSLRDLPMTVSHSFPRA
jgi:phosphomannomutase